MSGSARTSGCAWLVAATLAVWGCSSTGSAPQGGGSAQPSNGPVTSGPSASQRLGSAVEGAVMGAMVGGIMGPPGALVGLVTLGVYGAITGETPFGSGGTGYPGRVPGDSRREQELEREIENEIQRQASLEDEIDQELRRQEELLAKIGEQGAPEPAPPGESAETPSREALTEQADPRAAPRAPPLRELPASIFEEETVTLRKGTWGNPRKLVVTKRTLDADRDGKPEEIRYAERLSDELIRREADRDYDGRLDVFESYAGGSLTARELDENDDGRVDVWETYAGGQMTGRQVDRNHDGVRDAFYSYRGDSLVEERHDADNDGRTELRVFYEDRRRARSEEDRNADGRVDTWTTYRRVDGADVVSRVERDERGDGEPDTFESFARKDGKTQLVKREEDSNGDGSIDIVSIYEDGKLVRREIADPALLPL